MVQRCLYPCNDSTGGVLSIREHSNTYWGYWGNQVRTCWWYILYSFQPIPTFLFQEQQVTENINFIAKYCLKKWRELQLGERMLDAWRSKQTAENLSPLLNQMSLSDIIRSCTRNETLYEIFAMDNKYHLYDLREYGRELYDRLEHNIEAAFSDMNISKPIAAFASPSQLLLLQRFFNVTIKTNIQQISFQVPFTFCL